MASKRSCVNFEEIASKKLKVTEKQTFVEKTVRESFNGVSVVSVLNEQRSQKVAFLHGKFDEDDEKDAVIILERKPFDLTNGAVTKLLSTDTKLTVDLKNDIYSTYDAQLLPELCNIKATIIYPATKKHLDKYRKKHIVLITETAQDYQEITRPFLEEQFQNNIFNIQWVYNILEHKQEKERIMFEDTDPEVGFILLPDMKWDGKNENSLYVIAIPHKRGIKSLRDLTSEHVPLLQNITTKSLSVICEKFHVHKEHLRMYLHYQPSYYHLHVHINHVELDMPGTGVLRAHLLNDVIENLELASDYYQKKSLSFTLSDNDKLLKKLQKVDE